jgi:central kinetochore subunit Mis15/CHL4
MPPPRHAQALSVPTTAALPPTQLLPSTHPSVRRALSRLSRTALLSLALEWLEEEVVDGGLSVVYLAPSSSDSSSPDPDDAYPPSPSLDDLKEIYSDLQKRQGSKRDVLDRVLEGDWRDGISLYQLAMADMQYLYDHPGSQRWSALKIVALAGEDEGDGAGGKGKVKKKANEKDEKIPRFHPSTFLRNLQRQVLPDVKAHYNLDRHADLPLWILRVWIVDSPYDTGLGLGSSTSSSVFSTSGNGNGNASLSLDASRTFYIAFPDAAPYIYVSLTASANTSTASTGKSLRNLTLESVPKAFSRPRERYALERTGLAARNLGALCERRGGGRGNAAGGGWGVYYGAGEKDEKEKERDNPLGRGMLMTPPESVGEEEEEEENKEGESRGMKRKREEDPNVVKRRKKVAQGRFGNSARKDDGLGIERLDIRLEDPFPATRLFAEIDPPNSAERVSDKPKKRGRRSALEMELERERDDDDDDEDKGWRPDVRITFQGPHVFAGIRELVEAGIVDGQRMPGWMTGEEGVSIGVVRDGRIKGWKGSGV